jgi:hypothetical protein
MGGEINRVSRETFFEKIIFFFAFIQSRRVFSLL